MKIRIPLLFACCILLGAPPMAQEESAEPSAGPGSEPVNGDAGENVEGTAAGEAAAGDEGPVGASEARAAAEDDLSQFVPSREVPPDEQVLFPVDI